MKWDILNFKELSLEDLYSFLQLRSEVFVVEQECIYQDLDGYDIQAFHVLGKNDDGEIVAYTRVFFPDIKYANSTSIGRVVVRKDDRNKELGKELMQKSIGFLKEKFPDLPITISAQCYLDSFYNNLGFKVIGSTYLEDDIPHQKMIFE